MKKNSIKERAKRIPLRIKLKVKWQMFVIDVKYNYDKLLMWLPSFNAYQHNNGISITPHLGFQWYKYQGKTSKGCLKAQIHLGWIMWSCQLIWKY